MKPYILVMTHTKLDYDSRIKRQLRELAKSYSILVLCQEGNQSIQTLILDDVIPFEYTKVVNQMGLQVFDFLTCSTKRMTIIYKDKVKELNIEEDNQNIITLYKKLLERKSEPNEELTLESCYLTYQVGMMDKAKEIIQYCNKKQINITAILCNDVFILPIANWIRVQLNKENTSIKFVVDLHEIHYNYATDQTSVNQRLRSWACDTYIPMCDVGISVSDWGKYLYEKRYPMTNFIAIRNVANFYDIEPTKRKKKIGGKETKLVYIGAADIDRRIEQTISIITMLEKRYSLTLYLVAQSDVQIRYICDLKRLIRNNHLSKRVHIMESLEEQQLITTLNKYDIGLFYLNPIRSNHQYALPNKLFEYIQARLAIVMTPLPSIASIINKYEVGKVSSDFTLSSFAFAIQEVDRELSRYKTNSAIAANELNSEKEWGKLLQVLRQR